MDDKVELLVGAGGSIPSKWSQWNAESTYTPLRSVTHLGSSYVCKKACKGVDPEADVALGDGVEGEYWIKTASKGDKGDKGDRGIKGDSTEVTATEIEEGIQLDIKNTVYKEDGSAEEAQKSTLVKHGNLQFPAGASVGDIVKIIQVKDGKPTKWMSIPFFQEFKNEVALLENSPIITSAEMKDRKTVRFKNAYAKKVFDLDATPLAFICNSFAEKGQVPVVDAVDENGDPTEWSTTNLPKGIDVTGGAAVGQIIQISNVDSSGKPTEWKAIDLPSGTGGVSVPNGAKVGQIIQVSKVDGSGKPTEWKAVDMPKGEVTADSLSLTINPVDGKIYITVNGEIVGQGVMAGPPASYGDVEVDHLILKLSNGQYTLFNVKLSEPPTNPQVVTILSDNDCITFDKSKLTFTADNYDTYQMVTAHAEGIAKDGTANIIIRNSDELLTDTNITVYLKAESYNVDTTIPEEDMHTVTPEDFKAVYASSSTGELSLGAYSGTYTNLYIPETMEYNGVSYKPRLAQETTFKGNTTVQYVTIHPAVSFGEIAAGVKADGDATALFSGATSLIGVKYRGDAITILNGAFNGCSNLKFFDGLELQTQNTNLYNTFKGCTSLEYVQDMSDMTGVTNAQQAFDGCTSLKKCYGIPNSDVMTTIRMMFYNCAALESEMEIRGGVPNTSYCFAGCKNLKTVKVYAEGITNADSMFQSCTDLTCYLPKDSVSYSTVSAAYGNSADVTIAYLGGDTVPTISCWGDSTTSTGTDGLAWPARLQTKVGEGLLVKNMAISGEGTTSTSCRQGGNQAKVTTAFTIPAAVEKVAISIEGADGKAFGWDNALSVGANYNPVTIAGVEGSIIAQASDIRFIRMTAGSAVEVAAGTDIISANSLERKNDVVQVIYLGTNAGWGDDPETLLAQVQSMIDYYGGSNYIIMAQTGGYRLRTEETRAITFEYEEMAAAAFGEHWLNLREYLIANSLSENGLTATEQDTERMALGQIPWSILMGSNTASGTDDVHYNTYGLQSVCNAVYAKGVALGYWA